MAEQQADLAEPITLECKLCGVEGEAPNVMLLPEGWGFVWLPDPWSPDNRGQDPPPMGPFYACPRLQGPGLRGRAWLSA